MGTGLNESVAYRSYSNSGNRSLVDLIDADCDIILDVGCGAGDNAQLLKQRGSSRKVFGITLSSAELKLASRKMEHCWVADIEKSDLGFLDSLKFDAIMFSHVLEHVREPTKVIDRFLPFLKPGGLLLIAVPNVLVWSQRFKFVTGKFEYQKEGVLDNTHLRFFTYLTADQYLLADAHDLELISKQVTGSVPLWFMRRQVLPATVSGWLDSWGSRVWPNLFGSQVLIKARKL
jgi:2-polyprenyl-3-methyl-5-hydroxy-6-metoxy-1,4-benzoquinol methylase